MSAIQGEVMRNRLSAILVTFAAACGGGDTPTPVPVADSPGPTPDTGPLACSVADFSGGLTLGSTAMRVENDWFTDPAAAGAPNEGKISLIVGARLPADGGANPDIFITEVVKQTGIFPLNTAINYNPSGTATTYDATSFIFGNFSQATMSLDHFYQASTGSITLTAVGESDTNPIDGTTTSANYRELDEQGADVTGGCTTVIGTLEFHLVQKAAMAFNEETPVEGSLTKEELLNAYSVLKTRQAAMRANAAK
jgi:hypothetical protein